ncbi:hypothetical protein GGX14DRAFT_535885 [Mycena pura]|uniref:Uncharacterized protein n=1 Tax=Mycena pura TaxID=153505 RepID=A0AAD6Y671_9AGAR|nr:hypothetical protein GGX14DRAFT_535885 [Mycena pura]
MRPHPGPFFKFGDNLPSLEAPWNLHTTLLFTWTDYKTIFIPITAFACAAGPLHSMSNLLQTGLWIWMHLLRCAISNQARSKEEDAMNRPWRPLPSGRVTESQAIVLRWVVAGICVLWSTLDGRDQVLTSLGMLLTTFMHDEAGLSKHYVAFEIGATKIIAASRHLDSVSVHAVIISGILISTTIQAQDFPDVEGDAAMGRVGGASPTPYTRRNSLALLPWALWSPGPGPYSSAFTGRLEPFCSLALVVLGFYSGLRYYLWREVAQDRKSEIIWLTLAHLLPLHARTGLLLGLLSF